MFSEKNGVRSMASPPPYGQEYHRPVQSGRSPTTPLGH